MAYQSFGTIIRDPSLPAFAPERCSADMEYWALRCPCGKLGFRASGWPRVAGGRGSYFWRTVTRVLREARLPMQDGEPVESPFALPLTVRCADCAREDEILSGPKFGAPELASSALAPREAYRCRVCRRAVVELVVGVTYGASLRSGAIQEDVSVGVEVVACCRACRRQARIAWYDPRPSVQEIRLDQLYGRR